MSNYFKKGLLYFSMVMSTALAFITCFETSSFTAQVEDSANQYTDRVIKELNVKFNAIKTYSVETLTAAYSPKGKFTIQKGKMWNASGNRWHWAGATYSGQTVSKFLIVSDGTTVWSKDDLVQAVLKRPVEFAASEEPLSLRPIASGSGKIQVIGKTELEPGQDVYEIDMAALETPGGETKQVGLTKAWIGAVDGFLYKITEYDKGGNETSTTIFNNYEVNISIDPQLFHFDPPQGMQVINFTQPDRKNGLVHLPVRVKGRKPVRE